MPMIANNQNIMPTYKTYLTGFISSIVLTVVAFSLITIHDNSHHQTFSHPFLLWSVLILAFVQLIVQLIFFLHLGRGADRRWNITFFVATVGLVLLVVVGSVWIMTSLNSSMSPQQMDNYMQDQGSF